LAEEWEERGRFEWLSFIFDVMEFISSFLFIAPILALADVWGRRITSNKLMVRVTTRTARSATVCPARCAVSTCAQLASFVASSGISLLEFLFRAGLTTTANWIAEWSSMQYKATNSDVQNIPIAILSISYRVRETPTSPLYPLATTRCARA